MDEQERLLQEILNQLSRSGGRAGPDMDAAKKSLDKFIKLTNQGSKQEGERQSLVSKGLKTTDKAVKSTLNMTKALENASTAMRDNREKFSSLNPSIEIAGAAITGIGKVTGVAAEAMGGLADAVPVLGTALGSVTKGLGKFAAATAEIAATIVTKVGPMFTAELDRISTSFRTAASAGAVSADGMTGLAQNAINAGLSFDSFAKVISTEANNLTFAFGTSADAARGLGETTAAMRPFRQNLMALGVGVEQQNELTAKYITFQQRMGRMEIGNSRALAAGSTAYIKNLAELSRLTGKSIDETQKGIDQTMADVRAGASIRLIEQRLGGERGRQASMQAQGVIEFMRTTKGLEKTAEGFGDALSGNAGTEAARQFQLQFGTAGQEVVALMKQGQITRDEALTRLQTASTENYMKLGGDEFASRVGKMGTVMEGVLPSFQAFNQLKDFGETAGRAKTQTDALMNTQDGLTKQVINSQEQMIKVATELDKFALAITLPAAATTMEKFTEAQLTLTKQMIELAEIFAKEGAGGLTGAIKNKAEDATGISMDGFMQGLSNTLMGGLTGAAAGSVGGPVAALIGGLLGAGTGLLGSIFGGGRAEGGAAEAGKSYLVGEKGPELLKMGKTSGVVIPGQVGPGTPGRIPGTFDVKLGDGSVVTVDSRGNELYRKGPRIGGLQMSSFADGSISANMRGTMNVDGGSVNYERDIINGQVGGTRISSGPFSAYSSTGGVSSTSYGVGNGITVGAQGAATGGQFDALGQLRSVAGPNLGDTGGLSIANQGLTDMAGGPAAGQTQTIQGDGGSNKEILGVLQEMLNQQTRGTRLQSEQLTATRNM